MVALSLGAVIAAALLIWALHAGKQPAQRPVDERRAGVSREAREQGAGSGSKDRRRASPVPAKVAIAIVIDDIGYSLAPVRELIEIDAPLTFAILPQCSHSADAAEMLYRAGKEILLHLPMEPHGYPGENPGPGAVFLSMSDDEIRAQVERDLESVPHCVGVNNHMGSRFMEDREKLTAVMEVLRENGLFFIDSLTTRYSQGGELAADIGIRFASRAVFIDNDHDEKAAARTLMTAGTRHRRKQAGSLLMIGHPYPETVQALKRAVPAMKSRGFKIVPASKLVEAIPSKGRGGHRRAAKDNTDYREVQFR